MGADRGDIPVRDGDAAPTSAHSARASRPHRPWPVRWAWLAVAYCALGIGIVGLAVPVLPTAPFVLLAAFAADRGSPRLHARLTGHRVFGPIIRDWETSRAVARGPKRVAVATMGVSVVVMAAAAPLWPALIATLVIGVVAAWLWRRPEPPAAARTRREPA